MTIHETFRKENINKTWTVTIFADHHGFIESEKKGIKANFRQGEEKGRIYGQELSLIPYSVQVKAESISKRLWNEMNRMYGFCESRQKNGGWGISQYAYVR